MYTGEETADSTPAVQDASSRYSFDADAWPPDTVLWSSGPSSIGEKESLGGLVPQPDVMSASMNPPPRRSHQLGTKVEMVYSLLSMLGSHDREDMSKTLLAMSTSKESCIAMRQSGCLPLLVQLLHGEEGSTDNLQEAVREARRYASRALHNIVHAHPDDKRGRREARVLRLLEQIRDYCDHLRDGTPLDSEQQHPGPAIAALMKLSFDEEHRHAMCQLGGLQAIAELIQVSHESGGGTDPPHSATLRRYAGMALTNLTFGDGTNKAMLCSMKPFMRALVAQLHSPNEDLRQVTASVLRNLSWRADSSSKHTLREVGAVTTLMKAAMEASKEPILKSILSALWNLSAHCTANKADICAVEGALPFLVSTLTYKSPSKTLAIVENGGGILRNISSHIAVREDYRAVLRHHNCLQILLQHLKSPSLTVVSNACGTLWNLSARSAVDQQALWEMGAVSMLRNLVHSKHKMISMGSSAALRNLLSFKPASLDSPRNSLHLPSSMPSLMVRKQRALESQLDPSLSETCDNLDSPKTSPTPQPAESQFTFVGTIPYLPGRMYRSVNGSVPRSDSRDSIGSTHSEPLYYGIRSYHMFSKNLRYLAYEKKHPLDCCKSYFCRNTHLSDHKDLIPERLVNDSSQPKAQIREPPFGSKSPPLRHSFPQSKETSQIWHEPSSLQLRKDLSSSSEREGALQDDGPHLSSLSSINSGSSHGDFSHRASDAMMSPPLSPLQTSRPTWPILEEEDDDEKKERIEESPDSGPSSSPELSPESPGLESDDDDDDIALSLSPPQSQSITFQPERPHLRRSRLPHLATKKVQSQLVKEHARTILSEVNQKIRPVHRSTHSCGFSHGSTSHVHTHHKERVPPKAELTKISVSHFVPSFPAPTIRPQSLPVSQASSQLASARVVLMHPSQIDTNKDKHILEEEEKGKEDERAHEKLHSPLMDDLPTEIQLEAKRMAAKMEAAEGDDELTYSSISDIDSMKPPSVMGDIASLTAIEFNHYKPSKKSRHNGNGHRPLPGGLRRVLACNKEMAASPHASEPQENCLLPAPLDLHEAMGLNSSISDILENVNPPSAMDEVSIAGSYTSDSISSDILESHSLNDASNPAPKPQINGNSEMFERFNAAAAMVQVYSRELNNIMTGSMKSSGNSETIDHVKPPSVFQDITEVTVEDKTEVATDTMASDIEEELPHDDVWANLPKYRGVKNSSKPHKNHQNNIPLTFAMGSASGTTKKDQTRLLEENANIIVSSTDQSNHNNLPTDLLDEEILSLVSVESEEDALKNLNNIHTKEQNTPPTPRRGPRIVKPINKETIRQMQEKKNAENSVKSHRTVNVVSRPSSHPQLVRANTTTSYRNAPNLVKPTKTSALRASQNQKMMAAALPLKPPVRQNSFPRSDSITKPPPAPPRSQSTRSSMNKENVAHNGMPHRKAEDVFRPKPPVKQGTFTKSVLAECDDTTSGTSDSRTSTPSAGSRGSVVRTSSGPIRSVHSSPTTACQARKQGTFFRKEVPSKIASLWKKPSGNSSDPEKTASKSQSASSQIPSVSRSSTYEKLSPGVAASGTARPSTLPSESRPAAAVVLPFNYKPLPPSRIPSPAKPHTPVSPCLITMV